jgi:hypothetical protein
MNENVRTIIPLDLQRFGPRLSCFARELDESISRNPSTAREGRGTGVRGNPAPEVYSQGL